MKTIIPLILALVLFTACGSEGGERFNYTLIKSKLELNEDQTSKFDELTSSYTAQMREGFEKNRGDKEAAMTLFKALCDKQDAEIKVLLDETQFKIYLEEVTIERKGREQHNMSLIRTELALDSTQVVQFDLANEAFYTTLHNNHDNYHGKPDVYHQYYNELDVSRKAAFQGLMSETQFEEYLKLVEKYSVGKSEH